MLLCNEFFVVKLNGIVELAHMVLLCHKITDRICLLLNIPGRQMLTMQFSFSFYSAGLLRFAADTLKFLGSAYSPRKDGTLRETGNLRDLEREVLSSVRPPPLPRTRPSEASEVNLE